MLYTKRGDTYTDVIANGDLTGSTVTVYVQKVGETATTTLPHVIVAPSTVRAMTATLPVGKYKLEVQIDQAGEVATFPDGGYQTLVVRQDLGSAPAVFSGLIEDPNNPGYYIGVGLTEDPDNPGYYTIPDGYFFI